MAVLLFIPLLLLSALFYALLAVWPAMLLFGAVHSFLPVIPAFSFWQTLAILLLSGLLFGRSGISVNK